MSDLFKRNAPRLGDDEDRRAWEQVRLAVRPTPWWSALWARPAVRFGLPAVAVVLVGIVWVAVEQPASTRRPAALPPSAETVAPHPVAAPTPQSAKVTAPVAERSIAAREFAPAPAPAPRRDAGALQDEKKDVALRERPVAESGAPARALDQPRVATLRKESAGADANELAAPAPATAPQGQSLAPSANRQFAAMKATRGLTGGAAPTDARGGRTDELEVATTLGAVAAAIVRRPLEFTAPFALSLAGEGYPPETARIALDGNGVARATILKPGEAGGAAPARTFDRFADAGQAERILLVACEADHVSGRNAAAVGAALLAQAQRIAAERGPETRAAQVLVARLTSQWGSGN